MVGLFLILPVLAFDVWLTITTGRRTVRRWIADKKWRPIAYALCAGIVLAIFLTFFLQLSWGKDEKAIGFPIPRIFFALQDKVWTRSTLPGWIFYLGSGVDFTTGLAAPFIPFKIAEFLKAVKAELK